MKQRKKPDKKSKVFTMPVFKNTVVLSIVILLVISSVSALSLQSGNTKTTGSLNNENSNDHQDTVVSPDNTQLHQQDFTEIKKFLK